MRLALTGTPGTGKSTVASLLASRGVTVCLLDPLAERIGALGAADKIRQTREVDVDRVAEAVPPDASVLVSHYAHRLPVDRALVLRCHPDVLRERLRSRDWPATKVQENVEAEALGVILQEALDLVEDVFEADTTRRAPAATARVAEVVLRGGGKTHRAGGVDWSEVILEWY